MATNHISILKNKFPFESFACRGRRPRRPLASFDYDVRRGRRTLQTRRNKHKFIFTNRGLSGYTKTKRRERINAFRGMRSALDNGGSHLCEPYKDCAESEICAFDFIVRLSLNVVIDGDKSYINFKEQICRLKTLTVGVDDLGDP